MSKNIKTNGPDEGCDANLIKTSVDSWESDEANLAALQKALTEGEESGIVDYELDSFLSEFLD